MGKLHPKQIRRLIKSDVPGDENFYLPEDLIFGSSAVGFDSNLSSPKPGAMEYYSNGEKVLRTDSLMEDYFASIYDWVHSEEEEISNDRKGKSE